MNNVKKIIRAIASMMHREQDEVRHAIKLFCAQVRK